MQAADGSHCSPRSGVLDAIASRGFVVVVAKSHPDGEIGMVILIARGSFVAIDDAGR